VVSRTRIVRLSPPAARWAVTPSRACFSLSHNALVDGLSHAGLSHAGLSHAGLSHAGLSHAVYIDLTEPMTGWPASPTYLDVSILRKVFWRTGESPGVALRPSSGSSSSGWMVHTR